MKKQHLFRLSAILLFLSIILGIMPQNAFLAYAAEETASVLPEDGKMYIMRSNALGVGGSYINQVYHMYAQNVTEDGINDSFLNAHPAFPTNFVDAIFMFEEVEDGVFKILPLSMPGYCLQVGASYHGLIRTHAAIFENKPEQLWTLTKNRDGYYLSCTSEPDKVLGDSNYGPLPVSMESQRKITFYFEETTISFPNSQIHVKAPEGWYPGLWILPKNEDPTKWGGHAIMEKSENGWFSYPAPWTSECECIIANHVETVIDAQYAEHDELFYLEDTDFSTDKWVVITDDPNVDGDLTYQVYDYNPDEPPKTADPAILTIPTLGLLLSSIAIIYLLRRRKTAL